MPGNTSNFMKWHIYSFCLDSYIFNVNICIEQKIIGGALAQPATPLRGPWALMRDYRRIESSQEKQQ